MIKTKFKQTEPPLHPELRRDYEGQAGEIPEDWEVAIFGDHIDINPFRLLKKGQLAKSVPMEFINVFDKKILSFEIKEYKGGSKFQNGDTLMARITPCLENGKTAFVDILKDKEIGFGSTEFIILSAIKNKTDTQFVYYLAISPQIRNLAIQSMVGSSGRQRVQIDTLSSALLAFPSLVEQQQIASILSSLDDKIELNRKMNKTLEEIGKAIFKRWFVDFEFPFDFAQGKPNEDGKPYRSSGGKMVESELGEIPEGWKYGSLIDGVVILDSKRIPLSSREREKRKGSYPYYGATEIMGFVNDYIFDGIYLLVGEDGSVIKENGSPFTQYIWRKFWVNNHAHVLQGTNGFSTEFIHIFLNLTNITAFVTGAVQMKLNQENMKSIPMVNPPTELLNKFNKVIDSLYYQIRANLEQIRVLTQIRDSLLPRLMSGKLRVN